MKSEQKYIAFEGQAGSCEEAIALCGQFLYEEGYVGKEFSQECIEREKEFPTGLCTDIPVAIPHCKSKVIKKDGICYLRLKEPVIFRRMDEDEETIETRSIFNIAIQNADHHVDFLRQIMNVLTDKALLERLECIDINEVPGLLEQSLKSEDE